MATSPELLKYTVTYSGRKIDTVVTSNSAVVHSWINFVVRSYRYGKDALLVGLDIEWRPNMEPSSDNPVATLQLCVGVHCLIIQILHADAIPWKLFGFLADPRHVFVGVGIADDAKKLYKDCNLVVNRMVDLRDLAAKRFCNPKLRRLGLKALAVQVSGLQMEKPLHVTLSDWDCDKLSPDQVRYACIDAFVSCDIGTKLQAQYASVPSPCFVATAPPVVHQVHVFRAIHSPMCVQMMSY